MDKYVAILEGYNGVSVWYSLIDILEDHDIEPTDVLAALDQSGMIDIDDMYARVYHGIEEEPNS